MAEVIQSPPSKRIQESKKNNDKAYHLGWSKFIFQQWKEGKGGITEGDRERFRNLRAYGSGNQSESIYRDSKLQNEIVNETQLDEDGEIVNKPRSIRTGINHINTDNMSLMPRIKNRIKGYLNKIDYDICIDTIDDNSGAEKEDKKAAMRVQMDHGDFIKQFKQSAGIPVEEPMYMPKNQQELELFEAVNGFKLNSAMAMEKLVKHTFQISNWDNFIQEMAGDDACDLGWLCGRVYFDNEDFKFKIKYCDPEFMIVPYSRHHDFTEMAWVGYFEQMSIADLRMELPDVEEEELKKLAKDNLPEHVSSQDFNKYCEFKNGSFGYDGFHCWVLHTEWIDEEFYSKVDYTSKFGRKSRYLVESPEERKQIKEKNKPNHQIVDYNKRKLRSCSWVVGSEDLCFDWGMSNFQVRPTKNKVVSSYIVERMNAKPLTELLMPVMDDFKIAWMKFQDARSRAFQAGYALDFSMLQNLDDGDKKYSVVEIIKMWREVGILLYQGSIDGKYEGGSVKPFYEIPGTIGEDLEASIRLWTFALQKLQDITGLSPVTLGAISGQTATEAELSTGAVVDILNPMVTKMLRFKERCSESAIRKLQMGIKFSPEIRQNYEPVVGKSDMQYLLDAEKTSVQYGQTFEAKPDEEYKRMIIEAANMSLQQRRQGMAGLDLATHTYIIERVMQGGNLKELRMIIAYQEDKHKRQLDEEHKASIEQQGQQNQQLEQIKAQSAERLRQLEMMEERNKFEREILGTFYKAYPDLARPLVDAIIGQVSQMPQEGVQAPQSQPSMSDNAMMGA